MAWLAGYGKHQHRKKATRHQRSETTRTAIADQFAGAGMTFDHLLQMRVSDEFLAMLDKWRGKQSPIPSRAQAIRDLVERGLSKSEKRA